MDINHHFNFDEMPVALKEWFNDYSEELSQSNYDVARQISTQQVEQLLKAKWNQFEPYNNMCPTYDDHRTVVGCTAIALSQVLYHFNQTTQLLIKWNISMSQQPPKFQLTFQKAITIGIIFWQHTKGKNIMILKQMLWLD